MARNTLIAALAGLVAFGLSGCIYGPSGLGGGYGYDEYAGDGYGRSSQYHDRCYDAWGGAQDYYSRYDCYDRDDYRSGFSVNIGFGGGWYNDFYYPGSGLWLFDRYGARHALRDPYLRYWGGRRTGWRYRNDPNWYRGGGWGGGSNWGNHDQGRYYRDRNRRRGRTGSDNPSWHDGINDVVRTRPGRSGADGNAPGSSAAVTSQPPAERPRRERPAAAQRAPEVHVAPPSAEPVARSRARARDANEGGPVRDE